MNPLVSIIIPTYNRANLLGETLASVQKQSYQNWECIIVDNGSEDDTKQLVGSFNEIRFIYKFTKTRGRSRARNTGLVQAKGRFIQFLDSDDILMETKLEQSVAVSQQKKAELKNLVLTNFECFNDSAKNRLPAYSDFSDLVLDYDNILFGWYFNFTIPIHCGLFDSRLLTHFSFPENLSEWEDWFLWLHIFQQSDLKISFIDEPLALCRIRRIKNETTKIKENLPEAQVLETLKDKISEEDRAEYYLKLIQKRNLKIDQLNNSIRNYRQTRTFKISAFLKNIFGLQVRN